MIEMKKYLVFILCVYFLQSCGSKRTIYNYEDDRKEITSRKKKPKKKKLKQIEKPIIPVIRTTEDYIEYYNKIAMDEMRQYKIPASITLAQGILESGSGKGTLAVNANNHFGIKCHDWNGPKIYHDDDKKQECFRKYSSSEFSFRDHSIFLASRDRYASLFKLKKDDYKSWAKGLKKAGYATDRKYAQKLIDMNIPAEILIGKSGDTGLKQKKQVETIQKFRDGITKVLVATRVGEEGLDISEVNLVIFYDNVPSSIRFVQRRGRTGRKESGRLVVLIAKDTIDEAYYWIGERKIKSANNMAEKLSKHLEKTERTIDDFF